MFLRDIGSKTKTIKTWCSSFHRFQFWQNGNEPDDRVARSGQPPPRTPPPRGRPHSWGPPSRCPPSCISPPFRSFLRRIQQFNVTLSRLFYLLTLDSRKSVCGCFGCCRGRCSFRYFYFNRIRLSSDTCQSG